MASARLAQHLAQRERTARSTRARTPSEGESIVPETAWRRVPRRERIYRTRAKKPCDSSRLFSCNLKLTESFQATYFAGMSELQATRRPRAVNIGAVLWLCGVFLQLSLSVNALQWRSAKGQAFGEAFVSCATEKFGVALGAGEGGAAPVRHSDARCLDCVLAAVGAFAPPQGFAADTLKYPRPTDLSRAPPSVDLRPRAALGFESSWSSRAPPAVS